MSLLQQHGCNSVCQAVASSQPTSTWRGVYPESVKARELKMGVAVDGDSGVGAYVGDISVSKCIWVGDIKCLTEIENLTGL